MTLLRTVAAASVIALAIGGTALASDSSEVGNPGMLLYSNGAMLTVAPGSKANAMLMEHAKPYTGALVYASGGKLYTIENAKMGGQTLYDMVRDPAAAALLR